LVKKKWTKVGGQGRKAAGGRTSGASGGEPKGGKKCPAH